MRKVVRRQHNACSCLWRTRPRLEAAQGVGGHRRRGAADGAGGTHGIGHERVRWSGSAAQVAYDDLLA